MLKNPKFYKYLGFALFACSAFVTMEFMWSSALGFWATIIASIQGTAIEASKSGFTYIAVSIESNYWKVFFGLLAFIAFIFSVIFTFGYSTNMSNQIKNEQMYSSEKYAQQQDDSTRQKDLYAETKKAIDDLKSQRDSQVEGMEAARDQLPKNFRSQRVTETDKINKSKADYQAKIEAKESELKKSDEKLNGIKTEELPEEGYTTMYDMFAKAVNTMFAPKPKGRVEKKPWTGSDIEFWFQIIISLFLEFCGIGCLIYSQYINADERPMITPKKTPISNNKGGSIGFQPQTAKQYYEDYDDEPRAYMPTKRPIGFQATSTVTASATLSPKLEKVENQSRSKFDDGITPLNQELNTVSLESQSQSKFYSFKREDILRYIDFMFENIKAENKSPGVKKIWENVGNGSPLEDFRKIHGHLENLGIVITENNSTTRVLCAKSEALSKI